jgi:hypothetical protein
MEAKKRRAGRPKAAPQTGPLVLEDDRRRVKIEVEIAEPTAEELGEYARWVELSSDVTTAEALSRTVQYALRELFRRDRLWRGQRGQREADGGRETAPTAPTAPPAPSPAPARAPNSLPLPSGSPAGGRSAG